MDISKYNDSATNFKLIHAADSHSFTKRNLKVWAMIMNRLGLPESSQEPVMAIYVSGNWDETEWDEINIMRMAKNLTSNLNDIDRIYNRLKKSIPRFFEWQDNQPFVIVLREIVNERAQRYKTKARYNFVLYDIVTHLFNLPKEMPIPAVRKAVEQALKDYPIVDKPSRKSKKRKIKSVAKAIIRNVNELIDLTGSAMLAAVEVDEENFGDEKVTIFANALLQIKDL